VTDDRSAVPSVPGLEEPDSTTGSAIDITVPHSARIWNYWLGGKDNYEADRLAGDEYVRVYPGIVDIARAGRAFLARAIRYLTGEAGVRQFLDVGTGLPTVDNTHGLAQRDAPESRVVYVDNDPLVLAHARALLTSTPEGATAYIDADMCDPEAILARAAATLDFAKPIALMLIGVIGHIVDDDEAQSIVQRLLAGLPSGSFLALFDGLDSISEEMSEAQQGYNDTDEASYKLRGPEQIARFFDGLEFVEPGLVRSAQWRPDSTRLGTGSEVPMLAGVGRKPYAKALEFQQETLGQRRRVLGEDHPDTLASANDLSVTLQSLGRHKEALALAQDTYDRRRRVLGEDHPDTLTSADDLAGMLGASGQHREALALAQDTYDRRRRMLGADHPDTLTSARNLATNLEGLGRRKAALLGMGQKSKKRKGGPTRSPVTAGSSGPLEGASGAGAGGLQGRSPAVGGGDGGGPRDGDPVGGGIPQARRRYLKGQCPDGIAVGKPFSLLASIVMAAGPSGAELEPFDVPSEGRDVLLVVHAPGLRLLGDQRQTVHVPANGDSRPVMFELRADSPGPRPVSITAWIGGAYLGELLVEITAERDHPPGPHRDVLAEIATEPTEGAVSLVVRYDPAQNAYRFEFRDEDNPHEVTSNLAYDAAPLVEQLVAELDGLAKGRSGYSVAQTRGYLVNAGARLWSQLVPAQLREQFWDRQHRIRQLTILADKDAVPWELLYPMDPGHDAGFLVEQFPVARAIFGRRPARRLSLWPARFVLPEGSLPKARDEIDAMRRLLDPGQPPGEVISALTPLQDLIAYGNFGLLHFACHNTYNPADGSSIKLDKVQFTPTLMTTAVINKALARSAPTVFINACRSAGLNATYNQLDGWASKFLEAGAGAFIGSLWAVSDGAAREFAQEFYGKLQAGSSLGKAVMQARQVAASQLDDPTWLAYTVYGDPRATISQRP
jgi:hypothetical protein